MQTRGRRFVMCGAAALAAGSLYLNALHNPFVYDDYHTVVANSSILDIGNLRAIVLHDMTRPIVNFSYALDRAAWGSGPFGFHVTNVLLHVLNVILLFQLAWRLVIDAARPRMRPDIVAFTAAALFAVHPLMTEAVGYVSGRSEVLCVTFFLCGLLCGRRWIRGGGAPWATLTLALWIATLATKEIGAMFPFVLFGYDRFVGGGRATDKRRRLLTVYLPLVALAVTAGLIRLAVLARVEYPGQVSIHWPYTLIALDVVRRYVWLLVHPADQTIFHEVAAARSLFDPRMLLALGVVGAMVLSAWRARGAQPLVTFGILWFLILLGPSSVLVVLDRGEPMAEHRVYAASCGLFLAGGSITGWFTAWLADASRWLRRLAFASLALVVLSFGTQTVWRNVVWSDPVLLWRESVDLAPAHYRPRLLLGEALQDAGRGDEAVEQFTRAIELRPHEPTGYVKLGGSLAAKGELQAARRQFLEAIRLDPANASAHHALLMLDGIESRIRHDAAR